MIIFDPIRKCYVRKTPEEKIRQKWIHIMVHELGYPSSLLAVEKEIYTLPEGKKNFPSGRRVDLVCYASGGEGIIPLLVVEFKAKECTDFAKQQLFGYNQMIKAPFLCMIADKQAKTFWYEKEQIKSVNFLPFYQDLLAHLHI